MFRYHFILFIRKFQRQKMFAAINLLGLTAGIVSSLLIYLYVQNELSYDKFHQHADRIYRVNQTFIWGEDNNQLFSSTGPGVAHAINAEIPEVKEVVRIFQPGNSLLTYTNQHNEVISFDEREILAVDSNFFNLFSFEVIKGNPQTALKEMNSMVLTESSAKKFFGDEEPLGKLIQVGSFITDREVKTYEVTGIVKDPPSNSYIQFDYLLSMSSFPRVKAQSWSWVWTMFETYCLLDPKASPTLLDKKLTALPKKYAESTLQRAMGTTYDQYINSGKQWNLYAQPLTDIHLYSGKIYNRLNDVSNYKIMYIMIGVVVFIILLSCINFMNLATAQYTRSAKETSLRKVLGSDRIQLSLTFFIEAFLYCALALVLGIGITQLVLPYFNFINGNQFTLNILSDTTILILMCSLLLTMSLLAGSYPAIFMSAFNPVETLKGKLKSGREGKTFRNSLVVFQFAISITLIICTLAVFKQLTYLSEKDTGFERENLIVLNRLEWIKDKETFFNALKNQEGIESTSWCTSAPPNLFDGDNFTAEDNQEKNISLNYVMADEYYAETLKLSFATGRNFAEESRADVNKVILNETAVKEIGWPTDESVIGKKIFYPGTEQTFEVVGIVKDFNYWSLQAPIEPMAIFHIKSAMSFSTREYATIRLSGSNGENWEALINGIEAQWKKHAGDAPFQYEFVDEAFEASFKGERKFAQAIAVFASLAILIACLGLLGMIIFTIELKTKEIGIRKVIGATTGNILALISKEYIKLILIATALSVPLSWWSVNQWLEGFEYRTVLTADIFIIAIVNTFVIAIVISSYQAIKATLTNPVNVLKDE